MNNTNDGTELSPDPNLQVIGFHYQHVGHPEVWTGKLVVLPPEYRWLLELDDNPQAYGDIWEDFNNSAIVILYVDIVLVENTLVGMLTPDSDGFYLVVTNSLIKQLTYKQLHILWEAVSNKNVELPQSVDRTALSIMLWDAVRMKKLETMAAEAMGEYYAGLTEPLNHDTL